VSGAGSNLLANVFEYNFGVHNAENAFINRNDRTMPAKMLATTARFRVARDSVFAKGQQDMGIVPERR